MAPLIGTDQIKVPSSAALIFKHPALDPLYIHSGATAIQWAYHLNTSTTPTIGGEVVQVLSAVVGPMTIKGQTAGLKTNETGLLDLKHEVRGWKDEGSRKAYTPNDELREIMAWFRHYMTLAGTHTPRRDERAIEFIYPERGWDFYIQVTKLDGFRYDKSVISPEWSITAEIVNDNALNYFAGITMSSFTDDLITNQELLGRIGMSAFAKSKTETANTAFGQTGDRGSTNPFLNPELSIPATEAAKKMGDNFQGLVAAWATGDFAHFGFGALLDNGALPKNVDAAYQQLFGTTMLGSLPGNSGAGTGTTGSFTYNGNNPQNNYAVQIANEFESQGVPAVLGIAVAIHESSLNPDERNPNDGGPGVDGVGLFQAHNPNGADGSQACRLASSVDRSNPPTKHYPAATQIKNAAGWFKAAKPVGIGDNPTNDQFAQWAFAAQRGVGYTNDNSTSGSCTQAFANQITQAKGIIASFGTTSGGAASGVRLAVIQWATKLVQYASRTARPSYDQRCRRDVENITPGDFGALPTSDCSNSVALLYCWGTNKDRRYATNGPSFNGSTTVTMWSTWAKSEIKAEQARAGDLVIYGTSPTNNVHVAMLMEDWRGDQTSVFSHGSGIPHFETYATQTAALSEPPHFFRILP